MRTVTGSTISGAHALSGGCFRLVGAGMGTEVINTTLTNMTAMDERSPFWHSTAFRGEWYNVESLTKIECTDGGVASLESMANLTLRSTRISDVRTSSREGAWRVRSPAAKCS
eukprot:1204538-Prymnesium_polylepis.1